MPRNIEQVLAAARATLATIRQPDADAPSESREVEKALFRSPAGKRNVVRRLLPLVPGHTRYVEPFAGGGALFFTKEPVAEEILNDKDPEIAFAYRFIKRMTPETLARLKRFHWTNRRAYFDKLKAMTPRSDLERFHKFIYINRFSYFSKGGDSATFNPAEEGAVFSSFDKFLPGKERLARVTILSDDYEKVIRRYDGPETFFFLDPPFPGYDQSVGEKDFDEERFAHVLQGIRGNFLVTYGLRSDRSLFKRFRIRRIVVPTATPKGLDRRSLLLIANYPIQKRLEPDLDAAMSPAPAMKVQSNSASPRAKRAQRVVRPRQARKSHLPAVLSPDAVRHGAMPPDGHSGLPRTLEDVVPPELRYWETSGKEARRLRDALVSTGFFTDENVRVVDGQLRRVVHKLFLYQPPLATIEKALRIPFQSWGGSGHYAKRLVGRLPAHKRYVEPFCGSAAVLFSKEPADEEVLADIDAEVVHALTYIRDLTPQRFRALEELSWKVSRAGFERARALKPSTDAERFWRLVYGRLCTWGAKPTLSGFSTLHDGQTYPLEDLWKFHERLRNVKIYRQDWKKTIERFDGPDTLFFIDPPYEEEWAVGDGIPAAEIAKALEKVKGQWIVAYTASAAARRALGKMGHLFTLSLHEARHSGAFAARPRLFASRERLGRGTSARPHATGTSNERAREEKRLAPFDALRPMRPSRVDAEPLAGMHAVMKRCAAPALLAAGIAVEPRIEGTRVLLHKHGTEVQIRPDGADEPLAIPELLQALSTLPGDLVLDGALVAKSEAKERGVQVFDVLYADRDLTGQPWNERQTILERLLPNERPGLVRVEARIAHTEAELVDAIRSARHAPGSAGAVLKLTDSIYRPDVTTASWVAVGPENATERLYERYAGLDQPIIKRGTDEERFTLGIVLEPDVVDAQGDRYTKEEVRRACHRFAEFYWNAGLMHQEIANGRIVILENYLAPCEFTADNGELVKEGTWLQGRGYRDDAIWARIKRGELTGLSIGGSAIRRPAKNHEDTDPTTHA